MNAKPNLTAKLGIAPIAWWNDDLAELSDDVSLEECLRQASVAGFTGMETGRRFPMDMAELGPILAEIRHFGLWRLVFGPAAGWRYRGRERPRRRPARLFQGRRRALHRLWRNRALGAGHQICPPGHQTETDRGRNGQSMAARSAILPIGARPTACRFPITTTWRRRWKRKLNLTSS